MAQAKQTTKAYTEMTPDELLAALQAKDADQVKAESLINQLQNELAEKEDEILSLSPTVKVGKDAYEIVIPVFNLYDKEKQESIEYTLADVQKDQALATKLIKMGSGVLRKIEK